MNKIIKKMFYRPAWAVACRKIENDQAIFPNKSQTPFDVLLPKSNEWYADSFIVCENNKAYVFMEIMGRNGRMGTLGVTEYSDGHFSYVCEILREPFHLSYPNVFKYRNHFFMIPETNESGQIRLYECVNFPYSWKLKKVLCDKIQVVDSSFMCLDEDTMLLFSHDIKNNAFKLRLFLLNLRNFELSEIEKYPSASDDRPGGNVIAIDGKNYRILQDCSEDYGVRLKVYEISGLSEAISDAEDKLIGTIDVSILPLNKNKPFYKIHTLSRSDRYEAIDLLYNRFYISKPIRRILRMIREHL